MADYINTEVSAFDSQSPPSSPAYGIDLNADGDCAEFQDTVPFHDDDDDDMVLDSPIAETRLDDDAQVVDGVDYEEEMRQQRLFDGQEEVVADSEDDDCGSERVSAADVGRLPKRRVDMCRLGERLGNMFSESGASNDQECRTGEQGSRDSGSGNGGKDPSQIITDDHDPRSNFMDSQEPGELTQANALVFVDNFLMNSSVNLSPETDPTRIPRMKSPRVSGAKGPQSLAKRIRTRSPIKGRGVFDWVDDSSREGSNAFRDKAKAYFSDRVSGKVPALPFLEATCLVSEKGYRSIDDNEEKKRSAHLLEDKNDLTHPTSESLKNGSAESCMTEQVFEANVGNQVTMRLDEQLQDEIYREQLEAKDDFLDVGIGTQIAVEAMGALLYAAPVCWSTSNADGGPTGAPEYSPRDLTKRKDEPFSFQNTSSSSVGGNSVSLDTKADHSELALGWSTITKRKRSKSMTTGRMNGRNSTAAYKIRSRENSCKLIDHRNMEVAGSKFVNGFEAYPSPSTVSELDLLDKGKSKRKPVSHQVTQSIPGCSTDQVHGQGKRTNKAVANGFQQDARKKRDAAAPLAMLNDRRKKKFIPKEQTGIKLDAIPSLIKLDVWNYPKGKRSGIKVERRLDRSSKSQAKVSVVTVQQSIPHSVRFQRFSTDSDRYSRNKLETEENMQSGGTGLSRHWFQTCSDKSGQRDDTDSSSFNMKENNQESAVLTNKVSQPCHPESDDTDNHEDFSNLASSSVMRDGYYKKGCRKNLPKSSLLKELVRLGVPEGLNDFTWKDLRRRRNTACTQVLFSQHLDDDVIKQQKKILARLGISVASSSVDATHFIAERFVRTRNMLEAIALGKLVVTPSWLESCGQASCLIDERSYILRDSKKEKEIGFSMPVTLARASQTPLLKGKRFFITPNVKPDKETITRLVKAGHGQVEERSQTSGADGQQTPDDLLILSCEEDREICLSFISRGAAVYSSELLLNGIVIQKLEYERHRLFRGRGARD